MKVLTSQTFKFFVPYTFNFESTTPRFSRGIIAHVPSCNSQ